MILAPREKYFKMSIGGTEKIQIKIQSPQNTGQQLPTFVTNASTVNEIRHEELLYTDLQTLFNLLTSQHLLVQPESTETLVYVGKICIRTEKAIDCYRSIAFQVDGVPYGKVTIQHGAELCHVIGYEQNLLTYVKKGLIKSLKYVFDMHVTVASKYMANSPYIEVKFLSPDIILQLSKVVKTRLKNSKSPIIARRVKLEKNLNKIKRGQSIIGQIFKSSLFASTLVFDLSNLKKEIAALQNKIMEQNRIIRWELSQILPESPIYGCGNLKYFDESDLANVDDISKIHVRYGALIDGIQVEYRCCGMANYHGGFGGKLCTFSLGPDERIISVGGTINDVGGEWQQLSSITFETDCGTRAQFGKHMGKEFSFDMTDGPYLAAIKGYDLYPGNTEMYPGWFDSFRLVPAIGFIAKF